MSFDQKLYCNLLTWADSFLHNYKIDNLTSFDLIHEAYVKTVEAKEDFTPEKAKGYAKDVLYTELHISKDKEYSQPTWVDSWAVCTKCGEAWPVAAFGVQKDIYTDGYCKDCKNKMNKAYRNSIGKKKGVRETCRITVFNHYGEVVLVAKSMVELVIKFKNGCNKLFEKILYKGHDHKTIHLYTDKVKFLERRYTSETMNYYIKKEDI